MFRGYLRWVVVTLVAIATVINYIDRNALAIMWVEVGPQLGMDKFDTEESFAPAFILGAVLVPLAVISVWAFGGRIRPVTAGTGHQ